MPKKQLFTEIAKVGRLIGIAGVLGVLVVYLWASAFFSRPVSFDFIWHQFTSRWLLMVIGCMFLAFVLFVAGRLIYLISHITMQLAFDHRWHRLSKQKEALEKELKQFYAALKQIRFPMIITRGRKVAWLNDEMQQLIHQKTINMSDLERIFPNIDLSHKMSAVKRILKVKRGYVKQVFWNLDGTMRPVWLSAVCLRSHHPEQGVLWSFDDALSEYQNIAMEKYYDAVFSSLRLFHTIESPAQEHKKMDKMLKEVSRAYNLTLAGILSLEGNHLVTKSIYSNGKFSSIPSQFDLHDPVVRTSAVARAIKTKQCVGYADVAPLPYYHFLQKTNQEVPQSTCAFPIIINHKLEGVITLYGSQRNFFSPRLLHKLGQLFNEIFEAIGSARWRYANKQAMATYEKQLKVQVAELEKGKRILKRQAREMNGVVKDLIIARNQAEEASRVKSEFLASVSHELRTPLNAILGFSEAMETETFGPMNNDRYKEYTRYIYTSGKYLLSLINDVLDLSAVEAKKKKREETAINFGELVNESLDIIKGYPDGDKKTYIVHVPDDIFLWAEERSIRQILLNVLSNAVKFTGDNGRIEIIARRNAVHDLRVVISDNGIGIPKDKIKTLFQPFVQVENVMTREHKGSGLGLVLVKKLMESYQGTVSLSSKEGVGTKIVLIFPQKRLVKKKE